MTAPPSTNTSGSIARLLRRAAAIESTEIGAVLWSFAYFFCVLCSYYILRPLRDEVGVMVGPDGLQWLFLLVFLVMLAVVPVFGWIVSRFARRRIVPIVYGFFVLNLAVFWLLLSQPQQGNTAAAAFFVWLSVFNLIVVSLFWSAMSDLWHSEQAKRLYGFIAAGGSAGALAGPLLTQSLVHALGPANLLLVSAVLLLAAIACAVALRRQLAGSENRVPEEPPSGGLLAGAAHVLRSPYLRKVALWVLIANLIGTFFYLEQARIVGAAITERADRVQLFARMDLAVNTLAVLTQLLVTGRLIRHAGVGASTAALPATAAAGLLAVALAPVLVVIVVVMVIERTITFAITNPAMRVLYTVVSPEDKYKAQNFIDTVVFRGGDAASGWLLNGLAKGLGAPASLVATLALPFTAIWLGLSLALGREQSRRAETANERTPDVSRAQ